MALVQGGVTLEMQQALKNCKAVALAFKISLRRDAVAITVYCSTALSVKDQAAVECCLHEFHVEDEEDDDDQGRECMRTDWKIPNPLILFVLVPALPKRTEVEVEPSLFVGLGMCNDNDLDTNSSSSWQHVHIDPKQPLTS